MKKILLTLTILLVSTGLIDARLRKGAAGKKPRMSLLAYAAQLDVYAKMSAAELLDQNKAIEAWDIIGRLYDAAGAERKAINSKMARVIANHIDAYKKAEKKALIAVRTKKNKE